ncbi:MAG TPA: Hsp20/alpha crystallin family protein [Candidatus Sulfotelmatobacter sp.]|nr:Hsp20/alpha crystallin family protein [Candidatus Sulfotelmatobacter sp.]
MSITWWSPTADMRSAHRAMDRLFEQFFGEQAPEANGSGPATYYLPVDVFENDEAYTLVASVPGYRQDQVEITFEDGILSIKARAEEHKAPGRWLRQERPYGSFVRRLEVPQQVETGKISADFENGVLTITVPKTAKPQPVKIQIGAGKQATEPSTT